MKATKAVFVGLAIVGITALFWGSRPASSAESDKAEIVEFNRRLTEAYSKRDIDAVMAFYSDDKDAVFFEDTVPFQFEGKGNLRKLNADFFQSVSSFDAKIETLSVEVSGNLAASHGIIANTWTDKSGTHHQRSRYTQVLKKVNGKWLIWHEHFSVPFDPATGTAVRDAEP